MSEYQNVMIGCPTHDGRIEAGAAQALWAAATGTRRALVMAQTGSLLTLNCNGVWSIMLNERHRQKLGWFAMLHADIAPENGWVDKLIDEAERNGADVMSAVMPIKDQRGLTSTAIEDPSNPWAPWCRLTLKQVWHESFPDTFDLVDAVNGLSALPEEMRVDAPRSRLLVNTGSRLLVNTGCMVCRIGKWCEDVCFENRDTILKLADGSFRAFCQPEDWMFSRRAAEAGVRVMATRKIEARHIGGSAFPNNQAWGIPRDLNCEQEREAIFSEPATV